MRTLKLFDIIRQTPSNVYWYITDNENLQTGLEHLRLFIYFFIFYNIKQRRLKNCRFAICFQLNWRFQVKTNNMREIKKRGSSAKYFTIRKIIRHEHSDVCIPLFFLTQTRATLAPFSFFFTIIWFYKSDKIYLQFIQHLIKLSAI